jgi:hypothetical protein
MTSSDHILATATLISVILAPKLTDGAAPGYTKPADASSDPDPQSTPAEPPGSTTTTTTTTTTTLV